MGDELDKKSVLLVDCMLPKAHQYSDFQLLELIYQVHGDDLEQRSPSPPKPEDACDSKFLRNCHSPSPMYSVLSALLRSSGHDDP